MFCLQKTSPFLSAHLLTFPTHRLHKVCSCHHARLGGPGLWHTCGLCGSPQLLGWQQGKQGGTGSLGLIPGAPCQRCDSGQLTGGNAKESSIRQASYLQVAEDDTSGCEQKWNLLKTPQAAQTLQGS